MNVSTETILHACVPAGYIIGLIGTAFLLGRLGFTGDGGGDPLPFFGAIVWPVGLVVLLAFAAFKSGEKAAETSKRQSTAEVRPPKSGSVFAFIWRLGMTAAMAWLMWRTR